MTSGGMATNEAILTSWSVSHRYVSKAQSPTAPKYTRIVTIVIPKSRVRAALVRLVDNHKAPSHMPNALAHRVLLGIIERGDHLRGALPWIDQLLLIDCRENHVERLVEPAQQFIPPLNCQRRWTEDQDAIDRFPKLHLLTSPAMLSCRRQGRRRAESQPRLRQHFHVKRLDLMG
jgi:hypothetical protein